MKEEFKVVNTSEYNTYSLESALKEGYEIVRADSGERFVTYVLKRIVPGDNADKVVGVSMKDLK